MKAQVPGPPTVTSSPILKVISPLNTQATSSLSRCRWNVVSVPAGAVSSKSMMLSAVSPPTSLSAAERPGAMLNIDPPPGGTTKPFVSIALPFSLQLALSMPGRGDQQYIPRPRGASRHQKQEERPEEALET